LVRTIEQNPKLYVDVILPVPLRQVFTYAVPETFTGTVKVGARVVVQFGKRKLYTAVVQKCHSTPPETEAKPLISLLDNEALISSIELSFWEWMAEYYACTNGEIMKAALPPGLLLESHSLVQIDRGWSDDEMLSDAEEMIVRFLASQGNASIQQINAYTKKANAYPVLQSLLKKGVICMDEKLEKPIQPKTTTHIRISGQLNSDAAFEAAFERLKKAPKQSELFMWLLNELNYFSSHRKESMPQKNIRSDKGNTEASLKGLLRRGYLEQIRIETDRIDDGYEAEPAHIQLSSIQEQSLNQIHQNFLHHHVVLLHGVTASGKTEIYLKLIDEQLRAGRQVLYLLPEIGLSTQIIDRLKKVFGKKAGIYHSRFNDAERMEIRKKVWDNQFDPESGYPLIAGVRSALFLPFRRLGLIVVDEEQDSSYKQFDPAPRYNARDSAVMLALLHGAKVIMGSATPSFESYFNAQSGKYGYVALMQRYHPVEMPEIVVSDLRDAHRRKQMRSLLTPLLFSEIENALSQNEQVILFQNRRGFSPYIQCQNCSWVPRCQHCDVSLTYHKQAHNLQCHYCGYTQSMPHACPDCGSTEVLSKGYGTEKIEDELKILFPGMETGRLDFDSTRTKSGYGKVLERFRTGKTKILIGTQMITKGLDFEHVSVVGILNADLLLNFPDFRSFERAYQLMAQVSGRAGRKNRRGRVIIQTWQPEHPVVEKVRANDYEGLFRQSMPERQLFHYPPWFRLISIIVKHKNQQRAQTAARQLARLLKHGLRNRVLGPEAPLIGRMQQYYQYIIRIKYEKSIAPPEIKKRIITSIETVKHSEQNSGVLFQVDVDPL